MNSRRITYVFDMDSAVVVDDRTRSMHQDDSIGHDPDFMLASMEDALPAQDHPSGSEGVSVRVLAADVSWLEMLW